MAAMCDMPHLNRMAPLGTAALAAMATFQALDETALDEGVLPRKYSELTPIAVVLTTQCLGWS